MLTNVFFFFFFTIFGAAVADTPHCTRPSGSDCVPWWNSDYSRALRIKRAAGKSFCLKQHTPGKRHNCVLFKCAEAYLRQPVKASKLMSCHTYVSSISSETPVQSIWSRIRKISGKCASTPSPVLHLHGDSVADAHSLAEVLGEYFIASVVEQSLFLLLLPQSSQGSRNAPFTLHKLTTALDAYGNNCEGPHNVRYAVLKHLCQEALPFFISVI